MNTDPCVVIKNYFLEFIKRYASLVGETLQTGAFASHFRTWNQFRRTPPESDAYSLSETVKKIQLFDSVDDRDRRMIEIIGYYIFDQIFFVGSRFWTFYDLYFSVWIMVILISMTWSFWFKSNAQSSFASTPGWWIYQFLTVCSLKLYITIIIISRRETLMIRGDRDRCFLLIIFQLLKFNISVRGICVTPMTTILQQLLLQIINSSIYFTLTWLIFLLNFFDEPTLRCSNFGIVTRITSLFAK